MTIEFLEVIVMEQEKWEELTPEQKAEREKAVKLDTKEEK